MCNGVFKYSASGQTCFNNSGGYPSANYSGSSGHNTYTYTYTSGKYAAGSSKTYVL